MKRFNKLVLFLFTAAAAILLVYFSENRAFAAENTTSNWRSIYDVVLMWVNFGILVFVIIKFGKTPLMNFLHGRKIELTIELEQLEEQKQNIDGKVKDINKKIKESDIRLDELKEKSVRKGEKERQKIIEEAHLQSKLMLEDSKRKADNHIKQAKLAFRSELIDAAFDLATQRIPSVITDKDNDKLTNLYINSLQGKT